MSFAYVSSPGVPTIRPRNLSGVGTVLDAGRWSTSSVVIRGSCRYSLIFRVYSSSMGCVPRAALFCAPATGAAARTMAAAAATGHTSRCMERIRRDMSFLLLRWARDRVTRPLGWSTSHTQRGPNMLGLGAVVRRVTLPERRVGHEADCDRSRRRHVDRRRPDDAGGTDDVHR